MITRKKINLIVAVAVFTVLASVSTAEAQGWCGWNNFLRICVNYPSDGYCAVAMPFCDPVVVE
jgi:hypothetical protein